MKRFEDRESLKTHRAGCEFCHTVFKTTLCCDGTDILRNLCDAE